ncbi:MAG: DeoR/GlpR transcriptional regulator [Acidobacteria bacterium]|nr:DeoR/GlpR transcriptional regulator [Acidobacteriota bacterium]
MLIEERRQHILSIIEKDGRVLVDELSNSLNLSKITIRKDLDYLESRDLLLRTHGGALPKRTGTLVDPSFEEKTHLHHEEKLRIAQEAAKLVEEDQCIILDSGSTTIEVARALKQRFHRLTIITNALNIATELVHTDFEVILLGGSLRKKSLSVIGPLAEDTLREFHADILFLAVDGIDPKVGLTTPNMQESRVNRAMIQAADKVVAVCDSTKFERTSHSLIASLDAVHHVITDKALPAHVAGAIRELGVDVTLI